VDLSAHPAEQRTRRTNQARAQQQQRARLRSRRGSALERRASDRAVKVKTLSAVTGLLHIKGERVHTVDEPARIQGYKRWHGAVRRVLLAMAISTRRGNPLDGMTIQENVGRIVCQHVQEAGIGLIDRIQRERRCIAVLAVRRNDAPRGTCTRVIGNPLRVTNRRMPARSRVTRTKSVRRRGRSHKCGSRIVSTNTGGGCSRCKAGDLKRVSRCESGCQYKGRSQVDSLLQKFIKSSRGIRVERGGSGINVMTASATAELALRTKG